MAKAKIKPTPTAFAQTQPKVVEVPRLTPDQLDFLKRTNLRPGQYDRTVVVGGPNRVRKPTA